LQNASYLIFALPWSVDHLRKSRPLLATEIELCIIANPEVFLLE
jgi:hypothetical protein